MSNVDQKEKVREVFKYMSLVYDVTGAKALVQGREAKTTVSPAQWRDWISQEIYCGNSKRMLTLGIRVDHDKVSSVDLEHPIIVARFTIPTEDAVIPIPIDGWHRIQRAINENRKEIPAHYLSLEESEQIRLR